MDAMQRISPRKSPTLTNCAANGAPTHFATSYAMRPKNGVTSSPGSGPATQSCSAQSAAAAE
jgi:hypothetical protein